MGEKKTKLIKRGGVVVALLAAAILMGSVNFNRNEAEALPSTSDKAPAAEKTAVPKLDKAAPVDDKDYSDIAEDGFVLLDGFLYEVGSNGKIKRDFTDGMLSFDADGRYTSGDAELDAAVAALIVSQTAEKDARIDKLHRLYDYIRDNMEYVGYVNNGYSYAEPNGADGWGNSVAKEALQKLAGNCYYYNSAFAALARGLGYQAYIVTGTCGLPARPHCWCEIELDNTVYYCDPELEWSRSAYQQESADIFFKDWTQTEGWCYSPNAERQSEAKKAEAQAKYDAMIEYAKAHPSPRPTIAPEPTAAPAPAPTAEPAPEQPAATAAPAAPADPAPAPVQPAEPDPAPAPEPAPQPEPAAPPPASDPAPAPEAAGEPEA